TLGQTSSVSTGRRGQTPPSTEEAAEQAAPDATVRRGIPSGERLFEVGSKIIDVFNADAQPNQAIIDSPRLTDVGRDAGVGHGSGMADERLHASQAFGEAEKPGPGQHAQSRLFTALELDADHAPKVSHLLAGNFVTGVR